MCWNAAVSLNTFLFSSFVLALIIYNNSFTKYKIQELNSLWIYILLATVISMQLLEFFIWRNINNKYNNIFSTIAFILIYIQPIASIMIITNKQIRNILLFSYMIVASPYLIYKLFTHKITSVKSVNGHLTWKFNISNIVIIGWLFFFLFSFVCEKHWILLIFSLITVFIIYINYVKHNTVGSIWCWFINSIMIYYAGYLLFYLPFLEKMNIC
jgi:hypothetical protein